jgi:hypothetical protein
MPEEVHRRPKAEFHLFRRRHTIYISTRQLSRMVNAMKRPLPWDEAEETLSSASRGPSPKES